MVSWFDLEDDHPEIAGEFDRVIVQRIQFNLPDDFTALLDAEPALAVAMLPTLARRLADVMTPD